MNGYFLAAAVNVLAAGVWWRYDVYDSALLGVVFFSLAATCWALLFLAVRR